MKNDDIPIALRSLKLGEPVIFAVINYQRVEIILHHSVLSTTLTTRPSGSTVHFLCVAMPIYINDISHLSLAFVFLTSQEVKDVE